MDLELNNLQMLICHKTKQSKPNQTKKKQKKTKKKKQDFFISNG